MPESAPVRFYRELKRRKVIRVAVAYAIVGWLIVEIASVMFPELLLPDWSVRLVIALVVLGFPIALVLAWAFELTPEGARLTTPDPGAETAANESTAEIPAAAAAEAPSAREKRHDAPRSVAVLPFANLSTDPDNEYFSDGISEELLNLLCKLPQLTVASRTSSFSFKGKDVDMATVAGKLGVDAILEGSVRRSGDRVRITAQLIDAASDRHLWSETYDRQLTDVFAVQDEIANNIVEAMKLSLTPDQRRLIQRRSTPENTDAYDFYLRGRYYVERGDVDSGQRMFELAIEKDRNFALAWAGAADCHSWRCMWYEESEDSLRKADEFSRKALELAPQLAEAHAARLYAMTANSNYPEAEAAYRRAVELDPQLYEAHYYAGRAYFAQGKFDRARDAFAEALAVRPDDPTSSALLCTAIKNLGDLDGLKKANEQNVQIAEHYLSLNPDDALAWSRLANTLILMGEVEKGLEAADRSYAINPGVCRYNVACAYMLAGKTDEALDLLEEHARSGAVLADWLQQDNDWDAVRDSPRFREIQGLAS